MFFISAIMPKTQLLKVEDRAKCTRCNTIEHWQLWKETLWVTLFFIPIFPIQTVYFEMCPHCLGKIIIEKEEALRRMKND